MKLEVKNISKNFSEFKVLDNISFQCESGQPLGLLGRNGSGKTTTLRVIMDIFRADEGEILLDGKVIKKEDITIGYLPEVRGLIENDTIKHQLLYFADLKGIKKDIALKEIHEYLEYFNLSEYMNRKLKTLSKGNQQKVQIIQALIGSPDIIVLDEPFSGLDPINAKVLKNILIKLTRENKLIVFSSHQMNYIEEFCSNIVIIDGGKVKLQGDLNDIKKERGKGSYFLKTAFDIKDTKTPALSELKMEYTGTNSYTIITEKSMNEIIKILLKENIEIEEITPYRPSLFDIFIEEVGVENEENV